MKSRKPKTHTVFLWPNFFDPIQSGSKPFAILEEADFRVGDTLLFTECCPTTVQRTGHECRAVITYTSAWAVQKGNIALGFRLLPRDAECSQLGADFSELPMCAKP